MTIEDGFLLARDPGDVAKDLEWAEFRLREHHEHEKERIEKKIKTDWEKMRDGERTWD